MFVVVLLMGKGTGSGRVGGGGGGTIENVCSNLIFEKSSLKTFPF